MPDNVALYHTTHAMLSAAKIHLIASWLIFGLSVVVNHHEVFWLLQLLLFMAFMGSVYCHFRVHLDVLLLRHLATKTMTDASLDHTLVDLNLRQHSRHPSAQQRCLACLKWWRKALGADIVLCCISIFTLIHTPL